ncbi:MAG: hypothetical protein M1818_005877 [Claussenomyces sp. TS43310]|nr:MAG: hypothetical protein M1818_005877 [Claussenomyces sp. TS43310]
MSFQTDNLAVSFASSALSKSRNRQPIAKHELHSSSVISKLILERQRSWRIGRSFVLIFVLKGKSGASPHVVRAHLGQYLGFAGRSERGKISSPLGNPTTTRSLHRTPQEVLSENYGKA